MGELLEFNVSRKSQLRLHEQLDVLTLPPESRRKVARAVVMQVRKESRKNVRQQRCVDGAPFAPRKKGKSGKPRPEQNKRMLMGLARLMSIDAERVGAGRVSWRNSYTAKIADKHQHGKEERYSGRGGKAHDKDFYTAKAKCERWLAREIIRLGYRREKRLPSGKVRRVRVPQKWIMEHMRQDEAVKVWLSLSGYNPKDDWTIGTPARPFLGVNPDQAHDILDEMARQALSKLRQKGKI